MPRYNKSKAKELKEFLYSSDVHDAKLEKINYDYGEDRIIIKLFNPISDTKISLTFIGIGIALTIKGDWSGNRETIISLTVEKDFS